MNKNYFSMDLKVLERANLLKARIKYYEKFINLLPAIYKINVECNQYTFEINIGDLRPDSNKKQMLSTRESDCLLWHTSKFMEAFIQKNIDQWKAELESL